MPDSTTHDQYERKYNIVEERFGVKIRNGDRFDRFFRECEYKSAVVESGLDIVLWEDWLPRGRRTARLLKPVATLAKSLKHRGIKSTFQLVAQRLSSHGESGHDGAENWHKQMSAATSNVRPKLLIARKSDCKNIYHSEAAIS